MRVTWTRSLAVLAAAACAGAVAVGPTGGGPAAAAPGTDPARVAGTTSCAPAPDTPKRQFRAMWIASVVNIDWPSRTGLPVAEQQAEYLHWLDVARSRNLNAVVVQIRPTADAFWPSPYEPWSQYLTGVQGQDPGYDPLAFAVTEAHKRNLEFHAWFNPYRVSMQDDPSKLIPSHPARVHPDWVQAYGGKLYYDPGVPAVRAFVEDAMLDAITRYDIDGVHFDDYFYPYPVGTEQFPDDATFARYGGGFTDKLDWRRHNIDALVHELSQRMHAAKPWLKFGISPFGVWRNKATDPTGSDTTAGVQTYDDLGADTRKWVREQWLDYINPQVYWALGFEPAAYDVIVPWWSDTVAGTHVQLYIGEATYKQGTSTQSPGWMVPTEIADHLAFDQRYPQVDGNVYFSAKDVLADRLGNMTEVVNRYYTHPALVPAAPHLGGRAPLLPLITHAGREADGVHLNWFSATGGGVFGKPASYAVYRFDGTHVDRCGLADGSHLVATQRRAGNGSQSYTDPTAVPGQTYTYVVTALDRLATESLPSPGRTVRG